MCFCNSKTKKSLPFHIKNKTPGNISHNFGFNIHNCFYKRMNTDCFTTFSKHAKTLMLGPLLNLTSLNIKVTPLNSDKYIYCCLTL